MMAYYLWSDYQNGGKTKDVKMPNGGVRTVVAERNVFPRGEKITKAKLDVSDEEWDSLIEDGVVREYPLPDGADDHVSPLQAALTRSLNRRGDVDTELLLRMQHPEVPASEEEKQGDLPVGV